MEEAAADDGCSNGEGNYSSNNDDDNAARLMSFEILPWLGIQFGVAESNLASSGEAGFGELKIGRCPHEVTVCNRVGGLIVTHLSVAVFVFVEFAGIPAHRANSARENGPAKKKYTDKQ